MKGIIVPNLEDFNELKEKIQSRLNSDYEVCVNVVVTASVGLFKHSENFDIDIFLLVGQCKLHPLVFVAFQIYE